MRFRARFSVATVLLAVLLGACAAASPSASAPPSSGYPGWPASGGAVGDPDLVPALISSEQAVGYNRVLVSGFDSEGRSLASPDVAFDVRFFDLASDPAEPAIEVDGEFHWLLDDPAGAQVGVYVARADFARAGDWGLELVAHLADGTQRRSRLSFTVSLTTTTPALGAAAPASDTLTATDASAIARISSDANPDPDLYRLSISDAIAAGKPFVVVFATPAFCTSATCGPALELVKQVKPEYADRVTFIHVEPYEIEVELGQRKLKVGPDGYPISVPAVTEWGIPSEPYVFVVDAQGRVSAKFEGPAAVEELRAALEELTY
ncbi:MAG TPA: hypothetical protein VJA85_06930 [Candidatus Limnocylindria bacterium]|nr:hypothetical protein [Candidatus Limnocylindria bacterium]